MLCDWGLLCAKRLADVLLLEPQRRLKKEKQSTDKVWISNEGFFLEKIWIDPILV
jgi:hypothetical protein